MGVTTPSVREYVYHPLTIVEYQPQYSAFFKSAILIAKTDPYLAKLAHQGAGQKLSTEKKTIIERIRRKKKGWLSGKKTFGKKGLEEVKTVFDVFQEG